ncbi:globin domain-containing protein [Streptomyces armeniacus]|uniref:globin domain-containing protein n=1 Tax=Streptomyces armeniacus TaxID=83291 RepID=UPI001AD8072E|nr:globin domain-containing protein [Streptomyces armeniacus]
MNGTDIDVGLIRAGFEIASRRADHLVRFFYAHLFRHQPQLRGLFPERMDEQHDRFFAGLAHLVAHLDDPELLGRLAQLGRDHRKFGVTAEHYDVVGDSLVAAVRFGMGDAWSQETENAWKAAYRLAADTMLVGANDAERRAEPAWWDATVLNHRLHQDRTAVLHVLPERPYPYRAGQYATLQLPGLLPGVWRPYSIARAPHGDGILEFHVSRVSGGRLSPLLCDRVRTGDRVRLGPSSGTATAPGRHAQTAPSVTLMAAGSGWSPVKAVLEEMTSRPAPPAMRVELMARSEDHFYDLDGVERLKKRFPGVEFSWWHPRSRESPTGAARRMHAALLSRDDWADQQVYLSGPRGFIGEMAERLAAWGVPPERLVYDPQPRPRKDGSTGGHAERLLDPARPAWIDPAARGETGGPPQAPPPEDPAGARGRGGARTAGGRGEGRAGWSEGPAQGRAEGRAEPQRIPGPV